MAQPQPLLLSSSKHYAMSTEALLFAFSVMTLLSHYVLPWPLVVYGLAASGAVLGFVHIWWAAKGANSGTNTALSISLTAAAALAALAVSFGHPPHGQPVDIGYRNT